MNLLSNTLDGKHIWVVLNGKSNCYQ